MLANSRSITFDRVPYLLRQTQFLFCLGLAFSTLGCASKQYVYGTRTQQSLAPISDVSVNPMNVGGYHPRLDRYERFFAEPFLPIKNTLGLQPRVPTKRELDVTRQDSVEQVKAYLAANGLQDVTIDVRRYAPTEQWQRLQRNKQILPVWKYSFGTVRWLRYKFLPLRVFRSDAYDPFTNTLHINSASPEEALYQAAVAKQFHDRRWPGFYAAMQQIPFVPVYHNTKVANDILTYSNVSGNQEFLKELYPITHENIVSESVSSTLAIFPIPNAEFYVDPLIGLSASAAGKVSGKLTHDISHTKSDDTEQAGRQD